MTLNIPNSFTSRLLFSWWSISLHLLVRQVSSFGVQSGPYTGNTYAGGMLYDPDNDKVYVTGLTYDSNFGSLDNPSAAAEDQASCFVAAVSLDDWDWDDATVHGSADILESCQAIALVSPSTLVVGGNSEPGGLYSSSSAAAVMSGFVMLLDQYDLTSRQDGKTLTTSATTKIPYPQWMVTHNTDIFAVTLTSVDDQLSTGAQAFASNQVLYPNWITTPKYGSSLDMSVVKLQFQQDEFLGIPSGEISLTESWTQEFPIDPEDDGTIPRVYIGGIIVKNAQYLVIAGSTRGLGAAYGGAEGDDEDGFVTLLDLETGERLDGQINNQRFGSDADDVVLGVCDDPTDPSYFYIVGGTEGNVGGIIDGIATVDGSLQAWIMKIEAETLEATWTVQWGAYNQDFQTGAFAIGCSVVDDVVYVAGGVLAGAGMIWNGGTILDSNGGDDIWVAQLDSSNGAVNWMQQVGTDGDDHLSRNGCVETDIDGNVILFGDTTGSFYRTRANTENPDTTDVFVMILNAEDGSHADAGQPVAAPTDAPVATPAPVAPTPHVFTAIGYQFEGPLYAGGLAYDSVNNQALITGASFSADSQCFMAIVDLESGTAIDPKEYGNGGTSEACSAIAFHSSDQTTFIVGGTEKNGYLLDSVADPSETNSQTVQYGLTLQIDTDSTSLVGGAVDQRYPVNYPIAVVAHPTEDAVFVASMSSNSADQTNAPLTDYPNLTSGGIRKFGNAFFAALQRYSIDSSGSLSNVEQTLSSDWFQSWEVTGSSVYVSGLTLAGNGDTLVLVGSTNGSGGPFGKSSTSDMDGFILKVDPQTGNLQTENSLRSSTRLDSINQKDDWVTNVCNDQSDSDAIYVVGASQGKVRDLSDANQPPDGTTHAFIAKVQLDSLTAEWLKHFTMQAGDDTLAQASALGCAVISEGEENLVYVAGVIEAGAKLDNADVEPGAAKDDVFVVQMDGNDGTINWMKQIGTSENERLAHGGGVQVDSDGNVIVFAETAGQFWQERASGRSDDEMDLVVFTMNKIDGSYKELPFASSPTPSPVSGGNPTPTNVDLPDSITALQTGPDVGPTYAGGMYYDQLTNSIYLTGSTYGSFVGSAGEVTDESSCLFGILALPDLVWTQQEVYGTSGVAEACNAVSVAAIGGESTSIVVGSTESGGLLNGLGSGNTAIQNGIALDLSYVSGQYEMQGGTLMDENGVQFPITLTMDDEGHVWIVSMTSTSTEVTADFDKTSTDEYPNLTTGGIEKYGAQYQIVVERFELTRSSAGDADSNLERTLQQTWRKPFETAQKESVYVSGMVRESSGTLIVVGSTRGRAGSTDMDGLMAKINPDDGSFVTDGQGSRSVAYFSSVSNRDDWILNVCADPDDDMSFYIVGATQGQMEGTAFRASTDATVHALVAKMHVGTLTATWTKQFAVTHADGTDTSRAAASAYGCAVIEGDGSIYVAGTVENGATLSYGDQESAGRDDIFVAKLSTSDGDVAWLRQVGSNGDDRIAHGGGVAVDNNGNAVVFGDTNGSFFRSRTSDGESEHYSDLFVMIFSQTDGAHLSPLVSDPIEELPADTSAPEEYFPEGDDGADDNIDDNSIVNEDDGLNNTLLFAIIAGAITFAGLCMCCFGRRHSRRKAEAQKSSIFAYLQQFNVEDIDLRKSPPGGWHGTYLNKLSYGVNRAERARQAPEAAQSSGSRYLDKYDDEYEMAPLTHSSVVRDSLFMDTATPPSLGYDENSDADAMDDSYDDLRPRKYEHII